MGRGDNRHSPKMRRRRAQRKLKARVVRQKQARVAGASPAVAKKTPKKEKKERKTSPAVQKRTEASVDVAGEQSSE